MALHTGTVGPVIRADNMEPEVLRQLVSILSGERTGLVRGTDFAVTQNGGGAMNVNVAAGLALITGTDSARVQGQYHVYNDAAVNVVVPTANGSNPRVDLIVATIQDAYYSGALNSCILQDVAGTPAASPAVPATPADSIVLAHIYVPTAAGSILTANINGTTGTNNPDVTAAFQPFRVDGMNPTQFSVGTGGTNAGVGGANQALVPGMQVTFYTPGGRNFKVHHVINISTASVLGISVLYLDGTGGTLLTESYSYAAAGNASPSLVGLAMIAPAAGAHTVGLYYYNNAAQTTTFTAGRGRIIVEDMGPV